MGFRQYVPRSEYPELLRRFWTDLGMIRLQEWRYCAFYDGPQISKEVLVWPRQAAMDRGAGGVEPADAAGAKVAGP
jgi:hypothetical protein